MPFIDTIAYIHTLKEMTIEIPQQEAITLDNVQLDLDAVLYVRVVDPYKVSLLQILTIRFKTDPFQASYGVQDPEFAVSQLAMTVMRSEVGKLMLDNVFRERANLNLAIVGMCCFCFLFTKVNELFQKELRKPLFHGVSSVSVTKFVP